MILGVLMLLIGLATRVYGENRADHAATDIGAINASKLARTGTDIYLAGIALVLVGLASAAISVGPSWRRAE